MKCTDRPCRTNVPSIAMSFSDAPFAYGPFVPHHVARQYIETYFSSHEIDDVLELNTTVERLCKVPNRKSAAGREQWNLTLRKYDPVQHVDHWWEERFDAVILANGHYSVPYVRKAYNVRTPHPELTHRRFRSYPASKHTSAGFPTE